MIRIQTLVSSERLTSEPSEFLQDILDRSVLVETTQDRYKLCSFLHFLDVPNGAQKSHEGGTSWNEEEAVVVNGLVSHSFRASHASLRALHELRISAVSPLKAYYVPQTYANSVFI